LWDIQHHLFERIREFLALLVLSGLAAWGAPRLLRRLAVQARAKSIPAGLWGIALLIGGAIGAIVLLLALPIPIAVISVITLGKLPTSAIMIGGARFILAATLFGLLVTYGSELIVASMIGRLILQRVAPQSAQTVIWPLVLGILLCTIIRAIPVIGAIASVIVVLIGLGAVWLLLRQNRKTVATTNA
jgi:hypothetical protein